MTKAKYAHLTPEERAAAIFYRKSAAQRKAAETKAWRHRTSTPLPPLTDEQRQAYAKIVFGRGEARVKALIEQQRRFSGFGSPFGVATGNDLREVAELLKEGGSRKRKTRRTPKK